MNARQRLGRRAGGAATDTWGPVPALRPQLGQGHGQFHALRAEPAPRHSAHQRSPGATAVLPSPPHPIGSCGRPSAPANEPAPPVSWELCVHVHVAVSPGRHVDVRAPGTCARGRVWNPVLAGEGEQWRGRAPRRPWRRRPSGDGDHTQRDGGPVVTQAEAGGRQASRQAWRTVLPRASEAAPRFRTPRVQSCGRTSDRCRQWPAWAVRAQPARPVSVPRAGLLRGAAGGLAVAHVPGDHPRHRAGP